MASSIPYDKKVLNSTTLIEPHSSSSRYGLRGHIRTEKPLSNEPQVLAVETYHSVKVVETYHSIKVETPYIDSPVEAKIRNGINNDAPPVVYPCGKCSQLISIALSVMVPVVNGIISSVACTKQCLKSWATLRGNEVN